MVSTFTSVNSSAETCELRIKQLVELSEHRGVDYGAWARRAVQILKNDPRALADVGEIDPKDVKHDQKLARISEARRIEICAGTLKH